MINFHIIFVYPLVLLLFIPAIALGLLPYLTTPKKFRRTRNRITSLVLHFCVMTLAILALSGMKFTYDIANTENELLLLVDVSESNLTSETEKNEFVREVINQSGKTNKVGVVTFGFDQVYAAELTNDVKSAYEQYVNAPLPDTSASDIASVLNYARSLFNSPTTAKIVLISDGLETDGDASAAIRAVAATGIHVDTVYYPNNNFDSEIQLTGVELPESNLAVGDPFDVSVQFISNFIGTAKITFYDNEKQVESKDVAVESGSQSLTFSYEFDTAGLHKMRFELERNDNDTLTSNNVYYSYYYIESFDQILVITRDPSEATNFKDLLEKDDQFNVTVVDAHDVSQLPMSLAALRDYDEVVMFNIANADLPEGFVEILHSYVYDLGGGMLTVGGSRVNEYGETVANAYNRTDMYGTLYQAMLPVEAINYTPPLGLMIIIDRSGSMSDTDAVSGKTKLEAAKDGARSALYSLSERDYVGIITLDDDFNIAANMMRATQQNALINIIESIEIGGGTNYTNSIAYAGNALATQSNVQRRHIVLVSDGEPGDSYAQYSKAIADNYNTHGITFSMITVGSGTNEGELRAAAEEVGHGHYYTIGNSSLSLSDALRQDLTMDEIKEYYPEPFIPEIVKRNQIVSGITNESLNPPIKDGEPTGTPVVLGGYYGTKEKTATDTNKLETPLWTDYTPLYSQWKYGNGKVGSFMSDLYGTADSWSGDFMKHEVGQQLIFNMINALFPSESIRFRDFKVNIVDDNYTTKVSVFTEMKEGDTITVESIGPLPDADGTMPTAQTITRNDSEEYSRYTIVNKLPGVYRFRVVKTNADGVINSDYYSYKSFSYSKEYDMFADEAAAKELMKSIAATGRGNVVTQPLEVFEGFVETENVVVDPLIVFMILAIVLFLLDIAVRKFKWKWPHELVREYKEKKRQNGNAR